MTGEISAKDLQNSICQIALIEAALEGVWGMTAKDRTKEQNEIIRILGSLSGDLEGIYRKTKEQLMLQYIDPDERKEFDEKIDRYIEKVRSSCYVWMAYNMVNALGRELFPSEFDEKIDSLKERVFDQANESKREMMQFYRDNLMSRREEE